MNTEWRRVTVGTDCSKFAVIRQKIWIDLSKQPEELVAWVMDDCGTWHGYRKIPKLIGLIPSNFDEEVWSGNHCRTLLKSEFPNYSGRFEDSLLVRPEAFNVA